MGKEAAGDQEKREKQARFQNKWCQLPKRERKETKAKKTKVSGTYQRISVSY